MSHSQCSTQLESYFVSTIFTFCLLVASCKRMILFISFSRTCLVYRCGGTTLDVSVVDVRGGMYGVKCSLHRKMGGDKFTELISNFLADEFQK